MDALQAAQFIYDSTIRNVAGNEVEVDVDVALKMATFCAALSQAEQLKRIADAQEAENELAVQLLELRKDEVAIVQSREKLRVREANLEKAVARLEADRRIVEKLLADWAPQ